MPGRAKATTLKSREATAAKERLILEAVRLYRESHAAGSVKELGYRSASKHVEEQNYAQTGKFIAVDHNTVRNRHLELTQSHYDAHFSGSALMTREQEEELVSYVIEVADRGFPLTHKRLRECADKILRTTDPSFPGVGVNWTDRFLERHRNQLHTYWSRSLESARGKAVNPALAKEFYDILEAEFEKHGFEEENIYRADESGLMSGVAQKERVFGRVGKNTQHQKREVNRENTTIIVTICADGSTLPPVTIFKGKHFQLKWQQNNPLKSS